LRDGSRSKNAALKIAQRAAKTQRAFESKSLASQAIEVLAFSREYSVALVMKFGLAAVAPNKQASFYLSVFVRKSAYLATIKVKQSFLSVFHQHGCIEISFALC